MGAPPDDIAMCHLGGAPINNPSSADAETLIVIIGQDKHQAFLDKLGGILVSPSSVAFRQQ